MHLEEVEQASEALGKYVERLVAERQAHPLDDLVASLVQTPRTATG